MNQSDIIGGLPLISCPSYNTTIPYFQIAGIHSPVITFTFGIDAFLCLVFALLILTRYNSISLFGRRIYNNYINNRYWIAFFMSRGLEGILECTRYWLNLPFSIQETFQDDSDEDTRDIITYLRLVDAAMLICITILHSLTLLFLALALRWQIKHRGRFQKDTVFHRRIRDHSLFHGIPDHSYNNSERSSLVEREGGDEDHSPLSEAFPFLNRLGMTQAEKKRWWKSLFLEQDDGIYQFSFTKLFIMLFVLSNVTLYLDITPLGIPKVFFFIYLLSLCILYIPIICMCIYICFFMKTSPSPSSAQTLFHQASDTISDDEDEIDQGEPLNHTTRTSLEHLVQMDQMLNRSTRQKKKPQGPTSYSKIVLFLAVLTGIGSVFSFNIWSRILFDLSGTKDTYDKSLPVGTPIKIPQTIAYRMTHCIPMFASDTIPNSYFSFLDIFHLFAVFSTLAFFEFVRSEFARVKQRSVWYLIRSVRQTFGFHE